MPAVSIAFADLKLPILATRDGFRYAFTPLDLLTLARSIRKEGPSDAAALAWTYAQRYPLVASNYHSISAMITAHSQPINPAWFPTGPHCKPGGDYYGTSSCVHAAERPVNAVMPWEGISAAVRTSVASFAAGLVENPVPRSVDFAAADLVARKMLGSNPSGFAYVQQGIPGVHNSFVSTTTSRAWPSDDYVTLQVDGRTVGLDPTYLWPMDLIGPLVATAGGVALAGAALFGRTRR